MHVPRCTWVDVILSRRHREPGSFEANTLSSYPTGCFSHHLVTPATQMTSPIPSRRYTPSPDRHVWHRERRRARHSTSSSRSAPNLRSHRMDQLAAIRHQLKHSVNVAEAVQVAVASCSNSLRIRSIRCGRGWRWCSRRSVHSKP